MYIYIHTYTIAAVVLENEVRVVDRDLPDNSMQ